MRLILTIIVIMTACISEKPQSDLAKLNCMEQIIESDNRFGKIRNYACKNISLKQTIENYADSLQALNFTDCPKPFTHAFQSHVQAWRSLIPYITEHDSLRGEMHELFDSIQLTDFDSVFTMQVNVIWSTWDSVEYYKSKFY